MSSTQQNPYEILKLKATLIAEKYRTILQECDEANAEISRLKEIIKEKEGEINDLRHTIETLELVPTANPTREDVVRYRTFLSGLVREIDQCITDLTN